MTYRASECRVNNAHSYGRGNLLTTPSERKDNQVNFEAEFFRLTMLVIIDTSGHASKKL